MQQNMTGVFTMPCGLPRFTALPAAIGAYLRVKYDATYGIALAGASDEALGTLANPVIISGLGKANVAAIVPGVFPGVIKGIASGVIAVDGDVYAGASGKVAGTGTIRLGRNIGAATSADGDVVYYTPIINAATTAGPLTASATTADTFAIDSDGSPAVLTPNGAATITLPNATATLATVALAETLTNKTLTAPVVNSPVVTDAVVTVTTTGNISAASTGKVILATTATQKQTLPAATPGLRYRVVNRTGGSYVLTLGVQSGEYMADPSTGVVGTAAKGIKCTAVGSVEVACAVAGTWECFGYTGTWTAES